MQSPVGRATKTLLLLASAAPDLQPLFAVQRRGREGMRAAAGYAGADIAASVALPQAAGVAPTEERYVWLLGDTLLGRRRDCEHGEGQRHVRGFVHNAIAVTSLSATSTDSNATVADRVKDVCWVWGQGDSDGQALSAFHVWGGHRTSSQDEQGWPMANPWLW